MSAATVRMTSITTSSRLLAASSVFTPSRTYFLNRPRSIADAIAR
jgi:hypothetical protein